MIRARAEARQAAQAPSLPELRAANSE